MDHQKWLEWRMNGLGSSDAPVIMGVSPWKTKYQLWKEKTSGNANQRDTPSMARGREMEEEARCAFEKIMGVSVFPRNMEHPKKKWIRASLDGIDINEEILVEIKCPGKEDHFTASGQKVPAKYFPQCQHQLMVTGLNSMFYFSFDGKNGVMVPVKRDEEYIQTLWDEEHKFWELIEKEIPPETDHSDILDMKESSLWKDMAAKWTKWKDIMKEAKNQEEHFRKELINLSGGRSAEGAGVKLTRSQVDGGVDIQKAKDDHPNIPWNLYQKEPFERITIRCI